MRIQAGFTLIELVTTVAIVATMSIMAMPNLLGWIDNRKLTGAVTDLMGVVQHARISAAREFADVVINFDPDGDGKLNGEYLVFVDNGLDPKARWTREPDEIILHRGSIPPGIQMHHISFAGGVPRTRFNAMGFPNGLGGHVYLSNARQKYLGIHVNLNGNPRIVRSDSGEKGTWD